MYRWIAKSETCYDVCGFMSKLRMRSNFDIVDRCDEIDTHEGHNVQERGTGLGAVMTRTDRGLVGQRQYQDLDPEKSLKMDSHYVVR